MQTSELYIRCMSTEQRTVSAPSAGTAARSAAPVAPDMPTVSVAVALGVLLLRPILLLVGALTLRAGNLSALYLNVVIVAVDVLTLVVLAGLMRRQGRRLRDLLGRSRGVRDVGWILLTAILVVVGFLACNFVANLIVFQGPPPTPTGVAPTVPLWLGLWSLILMPVTIAVAEELAYRGLGQSSLARRIGPAFAVVVMAICFGLQHVPLSMGSVPEMLARFLTTFLAGLMFGAIVVWQKRLMPVIVGHWLVDVLLLGLPMLALAVAR